MKESGLALTAIVIGLAAALLFTIEIDALASIREPIIIPEVIALPLTLIIVVNLIGALYSPKFSLVISLSVIVPLILAIYFTIPLVNQ